MMNFFEALSVYEHAESIPCAGPQSAGVVVLFMAHPTRNIANDQDAYTGGIIARLVEHGLSAFITDEGDVVFGIGGQLAYELDGEVFRRANGLPASELESRALTVLWLAVSGLATVPYLPVALYGDMMRGYQAAVSAGL